MIEIIGKLKTISLDYATGKPVVAFDAEDKSVLQYVEQMQDKKLRIDVKQYKERRTLDQNAYWHKLLGELADVLGTSKPHMKNMLLRSYGQFARHNDRLIEHWIQEDMTDAIDENENVHLYVTPQTAEIDGSMYRLCYELKPSHELDTKEMSVLLDGTIEDCKAQGIQTMTPDELARMRALC